jgi:hypothetical protein
MESLLSKTAESWLSASNIVMYEAASHSIHTLNCKEGGLLINAKLEMKLERGLAEQVYFYFVWPLLFLKKDVHLDVSCRMEGSSFVNLHG